MVLFSSAEVKARLKSQRWRLRRLPNKKPQWRLLLFPTGSTILMNLDTVSAIRLVTCPLGFPCKVGLGNRGGGVRLGMWRNEAGSWSLGSRLAVVGVGMGYRELWCEARDVEEWGVGGGGGVKARGCGGNEARGVGSRLVVMGVGLGDVGGEAGDLQISL